MASPRWRKFWIVVETHHSQEWAVKSILAELGLDPYLPLYRAARDTRGERKPLPLFPGYLFAKHTSSSWRAACSVRGVRQVLMSGPQSPSQVHESVIAERIRAHEDELGYVRVEGEEPPAYSLHDAVTATRGMFAKQTGTFTGRTSASRCRVLFSILGRNVESEMLLRDLVPA